MRASILVCAIAFGAPLSSPAQQATSAGEDTPVAKSSQSEDLVAAAKEAKKKRKKPSSKVLTNKDVKKSTGTLIILPPREGAEDEVMEPAVSILEQHEEDRRLRLETEQKVAGLEAKVADLQRELDAIEYRYYEENDPDRRDKVIRQQFTITRKALEAARAELETARNPQPEKPVLTPQP